MAVGCSVRRWMCVCGEECYVCQQVFMCVHVRASRWTNLCGFCAVKQCCCAANFNMLHFAYRVITPHTTSFVSYNSSLQACFTAVSSGGLQAPPLPSLNICHVHVHTTLPATHATAQAECA